MISFGNVKTVLFYFNLKISTLIPKNKIKNNVIVFNSVPKPNSDYKENKYS